MNTIQLTHILSSDPYASKYFGGVFPSNHSPLTIYKAPLCFIINTDPSFKSGRHWLALYINEKKNIEFFDSYGNSIDKYPFIMRFVQRHSEIGHCKENTRRLQSSLSSTCGQFCLYFLLWRCRGISFENIVKSFVDNANTNDFMVTSFVNAATGQNTHVYDVDFIVNQCCQDFLPLVNLF